MNDEYSDFWLFLAQMAHFWEFQYFWSRITKSILFFEKIFRRQNFLFIWCSFHFFQLETLWHMFLWFKILARSWVSRNFCHLIFAVSLLHLDISTFFQQTFCAKMLDLFDILINGVKKQNWAIWQSKHFGWKNRWLWGFMGKRRVFPLKQNHRKCHVPDEIFF